MTGTLSRASAAAALAALAFFLERRVNGDVDVGSARDLLPARGGLEVKSRFVQQSMDFVSLLLVQQRQLSGSSTLNADTYPCYRFGKVALILFN